MVTPGSLTRDTSDASFSATAAERFALIPAMGKAGNSAPLQTFAELLAGIGSDGSRAHSLTEPCTQFSTGVPQISAATNAATFAAGPVAPGEMITLFGSNLTGGVTFDGVAATILSVSSTQVNVTVPYTISGSTTTLQMGGASLQLPVIAASPGIFAAVASGPGIVTLYGTGGGTLTADSPARLNLVSSVTVNGEPAQVLYAGVAPGLPAGANQINIVLPADVTSGAMSIVWTVGTASSNAYQFVQ